MTESDMAKTKYNPLSAIKEDPLAGLKKATAVRESIDVLSDSATDNKNGGRDTGKQGVSDVGPSEPLTPHPDFKQLPSSAPVKPLSTTLKTSRNTFYLYPEDLTKLRQLSGYASTEHGVRANDSMIVRAALSLMDLDVRFLHALKEAELSDRRRTNRSA